MRSHPVYYAEYCPYGIRAFSDYNTLHAFSSPLKRMHWVEENEATRQEITSKQARRWYGTKEMAIAKANVDTEYYESADWYYRVEWDYLDGEE